MLATPLAMVALVRLQHHRTHPVRSLVTLPGMVTLARLAAVHERSSPMLVTPAGIVTLVRPEQSWNA